MSVFIDSYHNREDVAMHGLMIQTLSGVQSACSGIQSELPKAEGIGAAQESEGQFVLFVPVNSADLQDFCPGRLVFRDIHLIHVFRELGSVVVGVNDTDKHL